MNSRVEQDDDLPVLSRVIKPGRVVVPAAAATDSGALAETASDTASAAPAVFRAVERGGAAAPPRPAMETIAPTALTASVRAELEERIRTAVLDDLQYRLDQVIRETLDRSLEPLLSEAVASVRQEIRDSLHGMVADSIDRAMSNKASPQPD